MRSNHTPIQQYPSLLKHQSGMALATSMIFLVIMGILSTSMFRNIVLQERMASNLGNQASNFEAANSSISRNWNLLSWLGGTQSSSAIEIKHTDIPDQFDIVNANNEKLVDVDVDVDICFAGEALASGFSWNNDLGQSQKLMAQRYLVKASSQDTVKTSVKIDRAGYIVLPSAGHPANCPS
ncbi:MAG: hypothetical protein K0U68_14300 [Gammaproteobacteria bacterium]|nr:hypothetical protein [Gammaproteobacteria bacterium]